MVSADLIPKEFITAVGSFALTCLLAVLAHINKSIPFKIIFGKSREYISKEELLKNCTDRQVNLDEKLDQKFDAIHRALQVGNERFEKLEKLILLEMRSIGERVSKIEGRLDPFKVRGGGS